MQTVTAAQAKAKLGQVLDNSQLEPISITKNGREFAVLMSYREYKLLRELKEQQEDRYWGQLALESEKEGFLDAEESAEFLADLRAKHNV